MTINGSGPTKLAIATYVDALGKVSGLANALLVSVTQNDTAFSFTVSLDITSAILGGRFAAPTTSPTAGK
jgi:hypothetical protein